MQKSNVTAIIVAGGKGLRMNSNTSKQYLKLDGEYIVSHTLKPFQNSEVVSEIIVVVATEYFDFFRSEILNKFSKISKVVIGGDTRQESVHKGLMSIDTFPQTVLIHDAVRPFVQPHDIETLITETKIYKNCTFGVKPKDTIKRADNTIVIETLDRDTLYLIQTPQGFDFKTLKQAHEKAVSDHYLGTDDSVLMERIGIKTKVIQGSYSNIKITTQEDLIYAEAILKNKYLGSVSNE